MRVDAGHDTAPAYVREILFIPGIYRATDVAAILPNAVNAMAA
jgi:hypothetical protein